MEFNNNSFILMSENSKSYTFLNRYDRKKRHFEGEYSLLFNQHTNDSFFLSKFLLENQGKPLFLFPSGSGEYQNITSNYQRFLENDIDKYVEEKVHKQIETKKDLEMDKGLGQLQLLITKQMVEKQLESIKNQTGKTAADHQVLLGKELSLQWVLHTIEDIIEKGNL